MIKIFKNLGGAYIMGIKCLNFLFTDFLKFIDLTFLQNLKSVKTIKIITFVN